MPRYRVLLGILQLAGWQLLRQHVQEFANACRVKNALLYSTSPQSNRCSGISHSLEFLVGQVDIKLDRPGEYRRSDCGRGP